MKYTLEEEYEYDFRLIGISCHEKDYRICWGLNNGLRLSLAKEEKGIEVLMKKTNEFSKHAVYSYFQEDTENEFTLLNNRSNAGYLVPEQAHADYLFMIKESYDVDILALISKIKSIPFVLTAFEVKVGNLKSKENLIF
jgi:hypothetical protein